MEIPHVIFTGETTTTSVTIQPNYNAFDLLRAKCTGYITSVHPDLFITITEEVPLKGGVIHLQIRENNSNGSPLFPIVKDDLGQFWCNETSIDIENKSGIYAIWYASTIEGEMMNAMMTIEQISFGESLSRKHAEPPYD